MKYPTKYVVFLADKESETFTYLILMLQTTKFNQVHHILLIVYISRTSLGYALYTIDIFAHNIEKKDKKTFFINFLFFWVYWNFFWENFKYFEMSLHYFEGKLFLIKILCAKMSSVFKPQDNFKVPVTRDEVKKHWDIVSIDSNYSGQENLLQLWVFPTKK